jgi:DNA-binding CsgD family transcriptional regulator/tetratricopeptide (TPR) repeat protein
VIGDLPGTAVARLSLAPLSEQAIAQLAEQANRPAGQLYAITGGNPFFVTEVLASDTEGVPLMVRDAVLARMARISLSARNLLELVSVVPARTERWLLDAVLGAKAAAVEECLGIGMLELAHTTVAFRHEIARQAVENTLSPLRRQTLHAQVLSALLARSEGSTQAARLVHHALGANDGAMVAHYAPLAAQQAAAQGAHREAAAQYATALLEAARFSPERQAELLEGRAYECYLTSQVEEARQARLAALRIWQELDRSDQVGHTLRWLSRLSWFLGRSREAEEYAAEAVQLLETLPPDTRLAMAYSNRAQLAMLADDTTGAVEWGQRASALAESLGDTETLVHALTNMGTALLTAQDERGRAYLERSLQLARERGWEEHIARAYTNLASCAVMSRDYPRAEHFLQEGRAYCDEHDLDSWATYLRAWQARVSLEQGNWDDAAEEATRVLNHYRLSTVTKIPALTVLGSVRLRRGDPGSMALLDEARDLALATGEPQRIVPVAAARAEGAWLRGDLQQCLAEARVGYDLVSKRAYLWKLGELSFWMWRAGGLARVPEQIAKPYALQIAGEWREAAELWGRLGCPYEQALALADGDDEAKRAALALFEQLGAQPAASLMRRQLREQGVTGVPRGPRPSTRANVAGLTSRQLEVLQLMVEGYSNAEIAHRLFTSPRTVEHHVSAVLARLDVRSRAQAISAAYTLGLVPKIGEPQA